MFGDDPEDLAKINIWDERLWYLCNPSLGHHLKIRTLRLEAMLYGDPFNFELGLFGPYSIRVDESYKAAQRLKTILGDVMDPKDIPVQEILEGCSDPNFRDEKLLRPEKGIVTPADVVTSMLNPGEIKAIAFEIDRLTGYRQQTIQEVKNA